MNIVFGDLWDAPEGYVIAVTTNSVINRDGSLVMGMGAAQQLAEREPWVPEVAGLAVADQCGTLGFYGWKTVRGPTSRRVYGLFQTKLHYENPSTLELIERSAEVLYAWQERTQQPVACNFPGIGLGRLPAQAVYDAMYRVFGARTESGPDLALYTWPLSRNDATRMQARRGRRLYDGVGRTR